MNRIKVIVASIFFLGSFLTNAQNTEISPVAQGTWLIETNTGFGGMHPSNTGMALRVTNNNVLWNIGGEGAYFIKDRLAVKLGLGYGNFATGSTIFSTSGGGAGESGEGGTGSGEAGEAGSGGAEGGTTVDAGSGTSGTGGTALAGLGSILSYKLGVKYYFADRIPVQLDFSGTSVSGYNYELGLQAGYAFFLGEKKNISIEPGVRYSIPLINRAGSFSNQFQMNVGFAILF